MNIFTYPSFCSRDYRIFRIGGPGLGNLLFPWARSVIAAESNNWEEIWPTWPQLKLGPIIRNEPDKRAYSGLFHKSDNYIGGIKRIYFLSSWYSDYINESELDAIEQQAVNVPNRNIVIKFSGMDGMFEPIKHSHELIKSRLELITKAEHMQFDEHSLNNSVAMHVRMGDFKPYDEANAKKGVTNMRLPLQWYINIANQINQSSYYSIPIKVFSDARDSDIKALLEIDNVQSVSYGSALSDMLALSRAKALVASNSTFSLWASYLGRMPVIHFKGFQRERIYYKNDEIEIEFSVNEGKKADQLKNILT